METYITPRVYMKAKIAQWREVDFVYIIDPGSHLVGG